VAVAAASVEEVSFDGHPKRAIVLATRCLLMYPCGGVSRLQEDR
jgi:hypothetical protein